MQEKGRKKNQEKRIILAFLREEAGILLWVVFFIGIFWLLCFLEDIPYSTGCHHLHIATCLFYRYRSIDRSLHPLSEAL